MRLNIDKKMIKNALLCVLFLCILFVTFSKVTYLFRNENYDRLRMIGLKEEENLDMIYVGGSSTFTYWEPLKAWNDCGFTSYNYATNSLQADGPEFYVREAMKTHSPSLFVVELRTYLNIDSNMYDPSLRNGSDGMDWFSVNRWKYIHRYLTYRQPTEDTDVLSYYLDIAKYHTNTANLGNETAWKYSDNREQSRNKGFQWVDQYDYVEEPIDFLTDERGELPEESAVLLNSLLDYCDEQGLEVLFVVAPKYITKAEQARYNSLKDIVELRGYKYLNGNEYYEEMDFDFETDLYNGSHVNCYGAEKWTQFLEEYIVSNYEITDHRMDENYSSWNDEYIRFSEEEAAHKLVIDNLQHEYSMSLELEKEITSETDFIKWSRLIDDSQYYVFAAQKGVGFRELSVANSKIISNLGMAEDTSNLFSVYNRTVIASNDNDERADYSGKVIINSGDTVAYCVDNSEGRASIMVGDVEFSPMLEGVNVVVLDIRLGRVIDTLTLNSENGYIYITR